MTKKWYRAEMKVDFMDFKKGDEVLTVESTIKHRHPAMGTSHWIMSRDGKRIVLVNDGESGMGLGTFLRTRQPVEDEKQEKCTDRAKELLKDSVYAPKNRFKQTFLYGDKKNGTRAVRGNRPSTVLQRQRAK